MAVKLTRKKAKRCMLACITTGYFTSSWDLLDLSKTRQSHVDSEQEKKVFSNHILLPNTLPLFQLRFFPLSPSLKSKLTMAGSAKYCICLTHWVAYQSQLLGQIKIRVHQSRPFLDNFLEGNEQNTNQKNIWKSILYNRKQEIYN